MRNCRTVAAIVLAIASLVVIFCTGRAAVAAGQASRKIKPLNEALSQLHRGDELRLEVTCTAAEPVEQVTLQVISERVIRGDTVYVGPIGAYTRVDAQNTETRPALDVKEVLALRPVPEVANTYRAELGIPLASHEYGLCYMTMSLLDTDGQELVKKEQAYSVIVELPLDQPGSIAGIDNWGLIGSYGTPPGLRSKTDFLTKEGLGWVNFKVDWPRIRGESGGYRHLEAIDEWVDAAVRQKARIIMTPLGSPIGHDSNDTDTEALMAQCRDLFEMLMKRYGDRVAVWDVWNEADCQQWIQQDGRDAKLVRIVRELRDEYCPDAKVVISGQGSTAHNWVRELLERGAGPDLDGIAWHPYRNLGPEYLEADNDIGNESGVATFLDALESLHNILTSSNVRGDIYVNEWTYALNLQPQLDDNDNVNFMVRAMILAKTTDYVKTICIHAFGNGRLAPAAYPNMTAHLIDTSFVRRCDVGEADAYAFVFERSDGRLIVPVWTSTTAKTVSLKGLTGEPEIRDLYGNQIDVSYDAENKAVDLLTISQEPIYVTAPKGSVPELSISDIVSVDVPQGVQTGTSISTTVNVGHLPCPKATLALRVPAQWKVSPATFDVSEPGGYTFNVTVPSDADPKAYPLLVDLQDQEGKALALVGEMTQVTLAASTYRKQYNIVFESDFAARKLAGWQIQQSAQGTVEVVEDDGASVLLFSKIGFDFPLVIEHPIEPTQYGAIDFAFKSVHEGQEFRATAGPLRLLFDAKGKILLGDTEIGTYAAGQWQEMRLFFSVPDGWCRVWQNEQLLGQFPVPTTMPTISALGFLSKQGRAGEGTDALLRAVRVTRIDPIPYESGKPLSWSTCGPFPNRIDPETGKRPFEIDKDWLAPIGGKANAAPYPGLKVPDGQGNIRRFLPPVGTSKTDYYLLDFMMIEDLLPPDGRGNVTCYAAAYVLSPEDQEVRIGIGSDDSYALWLNHAEVSRFNAWPTGRDCTGPRESYPVQLRKGLNTILIEVDQGDGAFKFAVVLE